jgi:hypothetical protein
VFAVGRGDFASIDRGFSDEHSAIHTNDTPLRAHDFRYDGRNLGPASQSSHLRACKRFAAWLRRSPEAATPDDVKYFQQHLIESGTSICTRNQTMTGVKFLLRVTLMNRIMMMVGISVTSTDRRNTRVLIRNCSTTLRIL